MNPAEAQRRAEVKAAQQQQRDDELKECMGEITALLATYNAYLDVLIATRYVNGAAQHNAQITIHGK